MEESALQAATVAAQPHAPQAAEEEAESGRGNPTATATARTSKELPARSWRGRGSELPDGPVGCERHLRQNRDGRGWTPWGPTPVAAAEDPEHGGKDRRDRHSNQRGRSPVKAPESSNPTDACGPPSLDSARHRGATSTARGICDHCPRGGGRHAPGDEMSCAANGSETRPERRRGRGCSGRGHHTD